MTRRFAALGCALLLLFVTAGCVGIGGQGDQTTTATPTQTTTDTTEATTTATTETADRLAPGVTTGGVEDARVLADAHRDTVENQSFVTTDRVRRTNASGTGTRNASLAMTDESHWQYSVSTDGMQVASVFDAESFQTYADGARMLWRTENGSAVQYGVYQFYGENQTVIVPPDQVFERNYQGLYARDLVYTLAANADAVEVQDSDEGAAELSGSADELALGSRQVTDAEFTMVVAADGQANSIDVTYESAGATVERRLTIDTDVTDPVEQPDWYGTALNETGLNETDA